MPEYLGGKVDVSLNGVRIPATLLSDEGVTTTITEGTRSVPTLGGTFNQPSGSFDEVMAVFNVVLPSMDYLKVLFPDMHTPSVDRPTVAGQTVIGGDDCISRENTPVVIHYSCQENSDNDIFIPNGSVQASMEIVQNVGDPVTVAITVNAQPDDEGRLMILGTGSLDGPTLWDEVAEEYEPVTS